VLQGDDDCATEIHEPSESRLSARVSSDRRGLAFASIASSLLRLSSEPSYYDLAVA